jgi:hypothetical protein
LAGCSQGPSDDPNGQGSSPPDLPFPNADGNVTVPLAFNQCTSISATIPFYQNLVDLDDGQTPPGWTMDTVDDDRYFVLAAQCQKVFVGPFERGPVSIMFEAHGGITPPDACAKFNAGYDDAKILLSLWIDDEMVGQYLQETYHLPITVADFSVASTPLGDMEANEWTWSAGDQQSTLAGIHSGGQVGISEFLDRLVWHDETTLYFLDLSEERELSFTPAPTASGLFSAPMKFAQGSVRPFTGAASVSKMGDLHGPIHQFKDFQCGDSS